jgi:hypothetical protein
MSAATLQSVRLVGGEQATVYTARVRKQKLTQNASGLLDGSFSWEQLKHKAEAQ